MLFMLCYTRCDLFLIFLFYVFTLVECHFRIFFMLLCCLRNWPHACFASTLLIIELPPLINWINTIICLLIRFNPYFVVLIVTSLHVTSI